MSAWQDTLGRIGLRIMPGAGGFWCWWHQSLLAWLPARWQWQLGLGQSRLLFRPVDGNALQLLRQRDQELDPLVTLPWPLHPAEINAVLPSSLESLPRHWLLPADSALRRQLRLPAAAAARLQDVARFEIDRQTPFTPDQVYSDARLLGVHDDTQIDVELVVVPRRLIDGPLGIAEAWMSALSGIDVADARGVPLQVNLLPLPRRLRCSDPMRRWTLLLALVAVMCMIVAGGLLLDNRRQAASALRAQIQVNVGRARQVAAQRQQLLDLVEGAAFFQQQRAAHPTAVEVWNELSRRLPATTYLEKFSIDNGQLQLIGLSSEASSLVQRLEGSPLWRTPSLTGVLQSDAGRNLDRFTITAELASPEVKEASDDTKR